MKYTIGIDLGGTNIVAAVVDEDCKVVGRATRPTNLPQTSENIADVMAEVSREAVKNSGVGFDNIEAVGVGAPGAVNSDTGVIFYSCNLEFDNVPMATMLRDRLGLPVFVENDANAAALGEFVAGAGRGVNDMIAITLGTGVGGGMILDGKIYTGFNHAAGELGHMVIKEGGRHCNCGRDGCLEAYASATGLIQTTREEMEKDKKSKMWDIAGSLDNVNGKTSFDAVLLGDKAALKVVDSFISHLATGVANFVNIFQPEVICIGGGVSGQGETLLKPLREKVMEKSYTRGSDKQTQIVTASLGNDAGLIGAAMIFKYL